MEYIHKAKAEKSRTKVINDQMEARRVRNKVRASPFPLPLSRPLTNLRSVPHRPPAIVVPLVLRRNDKHCSVPRRHQRNNRFLTCSSPYSTGSPQRMRFGTLCTMALRVLCTCFSNSTGVCTVRTNSVYGPRESRTLWFERVIRSYWCSARLNQH